MSKIYDKITNSAKRNYKFHIEAFDSAAEVVQSCKSRKITNGSFDDKSKESFGSWEGVQSYEEALGLMRGGYQPTVEAMRGVFKATKNGEGTRFAFHNAVAGFAPVVPLALKGVPNSMVNMTMKPIKAKVIDVYYDITNSCGTDSETIIQTGQALLGTVVELERQGYRFNLYAVQTYSDSRDCDMLVVKLKSATQPLDLKRISFPLTHTAFFRVVGFDWYSRVPGGKFRSGYGHAISFELGKDEKKIEALGKELFGQNAILFTGVNINGRGKDYIKEVVTNGNSKA